MATWRTPNACACSSTPLACTPRSPVSSPGAPKDAPMLHDGRDCLVAVRFSRGEDVITRDDPALDFTEHHLTAKLHRGSAFVSWNEARVRLKQTEHFLTGRDLPALQHAGLGLSDDALDERKEAVDLGMQPQRAARGRLQLARLQLAA